MLFSPYSWQIQPSSADEVVKATWCTTHYINPLLETSHLLFSTVSTHHQKLPRQEEGKKRERGGRGRERERERERDPNNFSCKCIVTCYEVTYFSFGAGRCFLNSLMFSNVCWASSLAGSMIRAIGTCFCFFPSDGLGAAGAKINEEGRG